MKNDENQEIYFEDERAINRKTTGSSGNEQETESRQGKYETYLSIWGKRDTVLENRSDGQLALWTTVG
jgi:hypothetical protein